MPATRRNKLPGRVSVPETGAAAAGGHTSDWGVWGSPIAVAGGVCQHSRTALNTLPNPNTLRNGLQPPKPSAFTREPRLAIVP